jgi:FkbM family methyltransferase
LPLIKAISCYKLILKNKLSDLLPYGFKKILKSLFPFLKTGNHHDEVYFIYKLLSNKVKSGIMIDVGACVGTSSENFAEDGWSIYAFEPDPSNRKNLVTNFKNFNNVIIEPYAVSNKIEKDVPFYSSNISSGISSLVPFHDSHKELGKIETITLSSYIHKQEIKEVDFLKIDTEGFDLLVLQGIPWKIISPKIIICEYENNKTIPLGYDFYDLAGYLKDNGYHLVISEWYPIVQYGGNHKWRCFHTNPESIIDENSWGNIIGIKNEKWFDEFKHQIIVN